MLYPRCNFCICLGISSTREWDLAKGGWNQPESVPYPYHPDWKRRMEIEGFRAEFPPTLTGRACALSHLQLCPPPGVVQLNVILNICQLNQSSRFSTREHYVDLWCSLENTGSKNQAHMKQPGGTLVGNFIYDAFNLPAHLWTLCKGKEWPFPWKWFSELLQDQ